MVSPLKFFHLLRCSLHATPVRNMLRYLHTVQGQVFPFIKLLFRLTTAQLCDAKFCRCCHSLRWMNFAGRTELKRHALFKRLSAGSCPCREWTEFVSCFFLNTLKLFHGSGFVKWGASYMVMRPIYRQIR